MRTVLLALAFVSLALAGCSGDDPAADEQGTPTPTPTGGNAPAMAAPMEHTVMLQNNLFAPADLTIHVGDTVTWHTMDVQAHNVVSTTPGQEFRSPDVSSVVIPTVQSDTYARTFTVAGDIDYLCEYHSGMVATLTVLAGNATA